MDLVYGEVNLITGPMAAGKSTAALQIAKEECYRQDCGKVLLIKFKADARFGKKNNEILTRNGTTTNDRFEVKVVERLSEISAPDLLDKFLLLIEEGQFFPDLAEWCEGVRPANLTTLVTALVSDYERHPFKQVLTLITEAGGNITHRRAVCKFCKGVAAHTSYTAGAPTSTDAEHIKVGGDDMYSPSCTKCHKRLIAGIPMDSPMGSPMGMQ
jgi:thymidine kinase